MDDELTFELRNQATNVAACFHPASTDQGRVWKPSGYGALTITRAAQIGWVGLDRGGVVAARPWDPQAGLESDTPPAVAWVRRDDPRAYLLELTYPRVHSWLTCHQSFAAL